MMRPGAGQNYPRSGFPLEGKAAPVPLPVGKGTVIPRRNPGTKAAPPARQNRCTESSRTAARLPPALSEQGLSQDGHGSDRGGSGLAPPSGPAREREVGSAAGSGSLGAVKEGDLGSPKLGES